MKAGKIISIPWELSASGSCARMYTEKLVWKAPAKLNFEAMQRMTDVTLISAEFEGTSKVFETNLWMLQSSSSFIEFIGFYMPVFSSDEEDLPQLCVRRSSFKRNYRLNLFDTNFISGEMGVVDTKFYKTSSAKDLIAELHCTQEYISTGLQLVDAISEKEGALESCRLFIHSGSISLELEYSPMLKTEKYIEAAFLNLKNHLDIVDDSGIAPDISSHRISYAAGVLEQFPSDY